MLSCVGDVDVMQHRRDELAIPDGCRPPTELPAEFDSRVEVDEIIDSEYPGYVYLMRSYLLTEDNDSGKYSAVRYEDRDYVYCSPTSLNGTEIERHGPALTAIADENTLSVDGVYCARCLSWPPQAAHWPTRHRKHGWPDSATVDRVVSNGCDVVQVAHPYCRQDEHMNEFQRRLSFLRAELQWRLSFSRAELVLLNSWMPVQQIIYHMLRFLVKTERLTDITDNTG